jgi:hypothetical protein
MSTQNAPYYVNIAPVQKVILGEISGSHGDNYEDDCILVCSAMQSGGNYLMFPRSLLSSSSVRLIYNYFIEEDTSFR